MGKLGGEIRETTRTINAFDISPPLQGLLPNGVWKDKELQEYVKSGAAFGYVGHSARTRRTDKLVVKTWRALGMTDHQIAEGITWKSARWMADAFDGKDNEKDVSLINHMGQSLLKEKDFPKRMTEKR